MLNFIYLRLFFFFKLIVCLKGLFDLCFLLNNDENCLRNYDDEEICIEI